jgi:hypothetical protein
MAIPQWDYLLPLTVSHGLVTVTEKVLRTREGTRRGTSLLNNNVVFSLLTPQRSTTSNLPIRDTDP